MSVCRIPGAHSPGERRSRLGGGGLASALAAAIFWIGLVAPAAASGWETVDAPGSGPPRVIGSYANGCLAGAYAIPPEGPGYQVIRLSRKRYFGHPTVVSFVESLGRAAEADGLGVFLVGDAAQPRGGPMPSGHSSHQTGLDVDIWLRLDLPPLPRGAREDPEEVSMLAEGGRTVEPTVWSDRQERLVRLAATQPSVERIFVNPAIKHALCRSAEDGDRRWLRKVRPWFGHTGHMHVRLQCPADSTDCTPQGSPPEGDGCGDELASWFEPPESPAPVPTKPRPPRILPAACMSVIGGD